MPKHPELTEKFAARLRSEILSGLWDGKALPSERDMSEKFGISRVTVRRGLKRLCAEGIVEVRPGRGYFALRTSAGGRSEEEARAIFFVRWSDDGEGGMDALHIGIANGAMAEARRLGLEFYVTLQDTFGLSRNIEGPWRKHLRGIILDRAPSAFMETLLTRNVPFVLVENDVEGFPVASVIQDNVGGMRLVLERIFALGHRRLGLIASDVDSIHCRQRIAGFREFLARASLPAEISRVAIGSLNADGGRAAAAELLSRGERPTAIFVAHREMLAGVIAELESRRLSFPRDISLAVWGRPGQDEPAGEYSNVTFVTWDREEMGRLAVRVLEQRVAAGTAERMVVRVEARLEERGSLDRPAAGPAAMSAG